MQLRQIFARNLRAAMKASGHLTTQAAVADRAGLSQGYVSEILRGECAPTVDILAALAQALGIQPWELLADAETTREAAIRKMVLGPHISNERAADHLPPAPHPEVAHKKKPGRDETPPRGH